MKRWYQMACLLLCLFGVIACKDKTSRSQNALVASEEKVITQNDLNEVLFIHVEEDPVFPGGVAAMQKWLKDNLRYPPVAEEMGISGKVFLEFVIGRDGVIRDIVVARGVDPSLDKEAVRVVSQMPKWIPGKQAGKPVSVKFTMPVSFTLPQQFVTTVADVVGETDDVTDQSLVDTDTDEVFTIAEEDPTFPGGVAAMRKWLMYNLKYPPVAEKTGISGKVFMEFVVGRDGAIRNITIARGVDPSLDKEAMRVVSQMPKWIPGKQGGKPVSVKFTMPITFMLPQK
jgi:TonB family protein